MSSKSILKTESKDNQSLNFQECYNMFHTWTPKSDVYAITNFPVASAITGGISAAYINNAFRHFLKLKTFGFMSSYIGVAILPTFLGAYSHLMLVQKPLFLRKYSCSVCLEVRSGLVHSFFAVPYPILLSSIFNFMMASKYKTVLIPSITQNRMGILHLLAEICQKKRKEFLFLGIFNFICAMVWSQLEMDDYLKVLARLARMEEELKFDEIASEEQDR